MASSDGETDPMGWIDQLREYRKDVWAESAKVSWPSRNELRDSTLVVIATVVILTVFVYLVDGILRLGVGLLFR